VVVWPEAASPFLLQAEPAARAAIAEAANGGRFGDTTSLVGSLRFPQGGFTGDPRNSLIAVSGQGDVSAIYDKWHLVPFGEYQPSWLPFLKVIAGGSLSPGPGPRNLTIPGVPPVGALICYEAIFSGQSVQEEKRPDWLVNITNDAWFGNSSGPRQHLAAARMRAVEEGLPLVRCTWAGNRPLATRRTGCGFSCIARPIATHRVCTFRLAHPADARIAGAGGGIFRSPSPNCAKNR
jgi:apolipoprotein N-acyltransferase